MVQSGDPYIIYEEKPFGNVMIRTDFRISQSSRSSPETALMRVSVTVH